MKLDFSKFTNAALGSMTTVKAALLFYMANDFVTVEEPGVGKGAGVPKLFGSMAALSGSAAEVFGSAVEAFGSAVKFPGSVKNALAETKENYSKVTFQFNPASLHISAYGGGMATVQNHALADGKTMRNRSDQVDYGPIDETVTVSFKVIFDAVRNERAFLPDRLNPSPTNLIRQDVNQSRSARYTVRPVAEGFLAAVRNRSTRGVIFQWGSLRYGGYLNKAQCRYTMFDMEGEAVRAEVELALVCSCHGGHDNGKEWKNRYDAFMKGRDSVFSLPDSKGKSMIDVATGKVEKACILFRAKSVSEGADAKTVPNDPHTGRLSEMAAAVSTMAAAIWSEANGAGKSGAEKVKDAGYVPVRVHYNPTSITMHSRGGEMITREGNSTDPSAAAKFQHSAMPMETVLSMELLFDDTNHSVAPISELFVAAAMSADSRMVCFVWNKMVFWGELCEVEVDYTMFNNRGDPIRSRVSVRIRQDGKAGPNGDFEKIWKSAYDKLPDEAEKLG